MTKPVILTGLRANNDLHIGNYFGAIRPMVDMARTKADEYQVNLFVPDLHSFTTPTDLSTLLDAVQNNLRVYVAAGLPLDNDDIHIYRQSYVPAHSELTWILNCFTGMGEMSRMTQFKDKSAKIAEDRIGVGLFDYPVLMAADILLYQARYIPVGDDQTQHLEFTRDIATRINAMSAKYEHEAPFTIPDAVKEQHAFFNKSQGLRIKDLVDPRKKMSKSEENAKGVIFLNDTPTDATKKIMSATTDDVSNVAYDPERQPGIANLLEIVALVRDESIERVSEAFKGETSYGAFKQTVAQEVANFLEQFQAKLRDVDDDLIVRKLRTSEDAMNQQANRTLYKTQQAIGIRPADK